MKTIALILMTAVLSLSSQAQEIPKNVQTNFEVHYPDAQEVQWEVTSKAYQVSFVEDQAQHTHWYSADGYLLKTQKSADASVLPEPVQQKIASTYEAYRIAQVTQQVAEGYVTYQLALAHAEAPALAVQVSHDGRILEKLPLETALSSRQSF
ncbi:hypothetical protein [Leeuwenhoekiella palythoae]|uniref:Beta-lactamase-inhibitor-like, PepSY-like n=1 Tax=Leeuwenhoekiella palythoae TaxID=573501 RepID=A0A1M5U2K3_9FLAO|nr:hypothetical protein [Leeuwenhoekiella palythoae]RXG27523.1 hypothetical protein DSM01_3042 [Leeuwenhoekiella palythoae]SHH57090.1 hypothetical protein SAMN04487999_0532 [Leeuwenhoekiella palythoae]